MYAFLVFLLRGHFVNILTMASFSLASGSATMMATQKADATLSDVPRNRTLQPIVTGTTVIGLKYAGGVMLAADTLASYGSMARYKDFRRLSSVSKNTILGASGEMSDFQVRMHASLHVFIIFGNACRYSFILRTHFPHHIF